MKNLKPEEMCLLSIDVFCDFPILATCLFWTCCLCTCISAAVTKDFVQSINVPCPAGSWRTRTRAMLSVHLKISVR